MNKTSIIIILSILLAGAIFIIVQSNKIASNEVRALESKNRKDKDSLMTLFRQIQFVYEAKEKQLTVLDSELLTHKAEVKRLEKSLNELLKRERYAQIENKKVFRYNDIQLDSAFRRMYLRADSSIYSINSKAGSF